jgi:hypothetical protein
VLGQEIDIINPGIEIHVKTVDHDKGLTRSPFNVVGGTSFQVNDFPGGMLLAPEFQILTIPWNVFSHLIPPVYWVL